MQIIYNTLILLQAHGCSLEFLASIKYTANMIQIASTVYCVFMNFSGKLYERRLLYYPVQPVQCSSWQRQPLLQGYT